MDTLSIKQGDRVTIEIPGFKVTGTVLSASNYGGKDGWYIELTSDAGRYHYWKQGPDGGTVRKVPTVPEIMGVLKP